ncbi:Activator of Hsp90 ATPase [Klebsormidium nitens]|uniref:Activator of Hsp90 ATPase n=1 Tax=Klebsormidium nitens TaxID=105231 RepID=A0A1Y1INA9_KLENI|nr:Activator of Hsp90 ATPase [Klebsormidium nitens]|eukprot:GAQ89608.1 Activator of Hsp90 ATPase [Klebsormidium nitens]
MAKVGEGDPRWIVTDRDDGRNVNGWHWTEKSYTTWSRQRLEEMVRDIPVECDVHEGQAKVTKLKRLDGDVHLTSRKGKKHGALYDITLTMEWIGQVPKPSTEGGEEVKGEIRIAEIVNGHDEKDYEYEVTVEGSGQGHDRLKSRVKAAKPQLLQIVSEFLAELSRQC